MIFGDKHRFAIEYEFDAEPEGAWLFGRTCYWIAGCQIGDFDLGTSLRDVLFLWERIAADSGNRSNVILSELRLETLFATLRSGFFGYEEGQPTFDQIAIADEWARHMVSPCIEPFDGWLVFLIEAEQSARCLFNNPLGNVTCECILSRGEFDQVLTAVLTPLQQAHEMAEAQYRSGI